MKIGYQGVTGAFSYLAGVQQFGNQASYVGFSNFNKLFESVVTGATDFAVVPYENSLIGTIYENWDLLARSPLTICAERYLRIEHSLLVLPGVRDVHEIKKVFSHIKALDQCNGFFSAHPWITPLVHEDTAGAAREIAALKQPENAAIAHASCADIYGLQVLQQNIEDHRHNYTRFIYVSQAAKVNKAANKTSVLFVLENRPGTLFAILSLIARRNVNITKIESRPISGRPFEYLFYLDLVWNGQENASQIFGPLLEDRRKKTEQFRCLGTYPQMENLW